MSEPQELTAYERRDIAPRAAVALLAGTFLFVVLALLAVWGTLSALGGAGSLSRDAPSHETAIPGMAADLRAVEAIEAELRGEAEWVDRERGIVTLPLDRAIEVVLEEGLPTREEVRDD